MRNIFAKLPRLMQGKMKLLVQQVFLALTYAAALKRERDLIAKFTDRYPAAIEGLERDLEECVTYLRFPEAHLPADSDHESVGAAQRRRPPTHQEPTTAWGAPTPHPPHQTPTPRPAAALSAGADRHRRPGRPCPTTPQTAHAHPRTSRAAHWPGAAPLSPNILPSTPPCRSVGSPS